MAWFKMSEWEWWNKLALVVAVLLGSLLLLTRPLVWKADASRLGIIVFVPLAVCCVRWLLRWPANGGQGGAGAHNKFKSNMSRVMWGVLLACVMTRVAVNGIVLATLLPLPPALVQARLLEIRGSRSGFNTWVLELEDGTQFDVEYGFLRSAPREMIGQTVRVEMRENRLGYYVEAE
ncbi:Uncharacterised protein [Helicobacter pametensis]|nr:Uncharacterised protein [Helicobacter pametensis]